MVVCKCRKATKLYCFVDKVPVCGECICFPEHKICVVRTYSEWVIDGEYDWPPTCSICQANLEADKDSQTTRLGCLHVVHTHCLVSHIQSFPPQTEPAGFVCPTCSSPVFRNDHLGGCLPCIRPLKSPPVFKNMIWPPKSVKDTGSCLHSKLKEAIVQSGLEKNVFGNHMVTLPSLEPRVPPPAFASDPLIRISATEEREKAIKNSSDPANSLGQPSSSEVHSSTSGIGSSKLSVPDVIEIDSQSSIAKPFQDHDSSFLKTASPSGPGATTRKGAYHVDRQNSEISYYADDEDGTRKKYSRRGPIQHKLLRLLLPFWSSALPTLPVTAPPRKDGAAVDDALEGHSRRQRSSRMDPRKILLTMAIMACMATMGILYYRLALHSLAGEIPEDELQ